MNRTDRKNIFMLGLNDFNRQKLESLVHFDEYKFHGLIPPEEAEDADSYDAEGMLNDLRNKLETFDGSIDAIVTYIDFPISLMTPILCKEYNLPTASLESTLKCHHKYWSRLEQAKVIGEHVPKFCKINPFSADPLSELELPFPFWLKPVKSVASYLGFRVENKKQFHYFMEVMRDCIGRMAEPFNYIFNQADLPEEIRGIDGSYCIAEELIGGHQCTIEGYVLNGEVNFHGVVDSIRHANKSTFMRYEYPSQLPKGVIDRMFDLCRKFLHYIKYDNSSFNIEFYWNKPKDKIWLLEVNTRVSQSHSDLFERVDGVSNHAITVNVGLGRDPQFPKGQGDAKIAAKFFLRKWEDAIVTRVPGDEEISLIEHDIPGVLIYPKVYEGLQLSDMNEQDSYSYELAWIFIGGNSHAELMKKYHACKDRLQFEFDSVPDPTTVGEV